MATQQPQTEQQKTKEQEKKEIEVKKPAQPQQALQPQSVQQRTPGPGLMRRFRDRWVSPFDAWSANPFAMMRRMSDDFDRTFDDLLYSREGFRGFPDERALWSPRMDVFERGDELIVRADLPGIKKEDLTIEAQGDNLIIEGERKYEQQEERRGYYRSEREYGQFRRVIALPQGAQAENASATFDGGVLEVKIKNPKRQGKRIEIGAGEAPKIH